MDDTAPGGPGQTDAHPDEQPGTIGLSRRATAVFVAVILLIAVVGTTFVWEAGAEKRHAKGACAEAVRSDLKAPASAKFHYSLVWKDGDHWLVNGTVDAQNVFGAELRSNFRCTVKDDQATVDYLV